MKNPTIYTVFCTILAFISVQPAVSGAQLQDTLTVALPDTIVTQSEIDTVIRSGAPERRIYDPREKVWHLFGKESEPAWVTYRDMRIEAYSIRLFSQDSLIAEGKRVTADPDSFPGGFRVIGKPVFTRTGDNPLTGGRMVYNLRTKKGAISDGRTVFEGGHYVGENITRKDEETVLIRDGYFTTCDLEEDPHFHFRSSQMKMKIGDKVVAKPVVFYIRDLPVFMLPFGVFPIRGGRTSGFILPSYGESPNEGRFLRGIGYYWAPNDYFDGKFLTDYYDKSGFFFRSDLRYNVRYKLNGSVSGSITRKNFAGSGISERRWDLRVNHSQIIDPTMRLSASGSFQSDQSFNRQFSLNRNQRANRLLYSSATLNKRWENSPHNLTVSASRSENLDKGNVTETLPTASFNRSTPVYPFKRGGGGEERFYESFNFTYRSQLQNQRTKIMKADSSFDRNTKSGIQHVFSVSSPQRVFRYLSVNPSVNLREEWYNEAVMKYYDESNTLVTETEKGFFTRRTFSSSLSANTKIYGTFNPNIGSVKTIRHVLTPTVSLNYTPDFSDPTFGYYDTAVDTAGNSVEYDRFANAMYGGTPQRRSRSMSFSLNNLFQVRRVFAGEEEETEEKFDLLSFGSSSSYNFELEDDQQKWSDIVTTLRLQKFFNFNASMSHSLYKYQEFGGPAEFIYDGGLPSLTWGFARLTRFSTSTSFSYSGGDGGRGERDEPDPFSEDLPGSGFQEDPQNRFFDEEGIADLSIPWDVRGNISFLYNSYNPDNVVKTVNAATTFNIKATKNWNVRHTARFDLVDREIVYQDFQIYRDLHCWELSFNWTPPGSSRAGFFLSIRIKDPRLRDIKVEKRDYGGSAIGYYR